METMQYIGNTYRKYEYVRIIERYENSCLVFFCREGIRTEILNKYLRKM